MITKIHLENFKGVKDKVTIDLKPITLLFGPNSVGKSTIIQAIHYMREILSRQNLDPFGAEHGGEVIDLGGFKNLVYKHDHSLPVILEVEMDISENSLPDYTSELEKDVKYYEIGYEIQRCLNNVKIISVKVEVVWHETLDRAIVTTYETSFNNNPICRIVLDNYTADGKTYYKIPYINFQHPIFPVQEVELADNKFDLSELFMLHHSIASEESYSLTTEELNIILYQKAAIPDWRELLAIDDSYFKDEDDNYYTIDFFTEMLTRLIVGPGELMTEELRKFRYIGPTRKVPPRNFQPKWFEDESRWADGLAAWDTLYNKEDKFVQEVSDWLAREDRLNTGYSLQVIEHKEISLDNPLMISLMQDHLLDEEADFRTELENAPSNKRIVLIENEKQITLHPIDVGVGISQVLPVVVGALDQESAILAVEQPELHIHPAMQVNLGDLFISQIHQRKCFFLLETHSEHLILRMLRRIEETTDDELPPGTAGLKPEQVSVIWFEQTSNGLRIENLPIDEKGEFTKQWPKGFFEERARELFR